MTSSPAILRFLGAAGTVTGSRFMLTVAGHRAMVDCGLFQGLKDLRLRNWEPFPVDPRTIQSIVLTHAHLDHSGYIPGLCRDGFHGRIHATDRTIDLCRILLPDSGRLQEEEAAYANRTGYSRHAPARALYTEDDALAAQEHLAAEPIGSRFDLIPGARATLRNAGHILGASSVLVELESGRSILFSGDLGRPAHPILHPPDPPPDCDAIVIESTYGDRIHDDAGSLAAFESAIVRTVDRRGVIVIPSFAVDRTEVVLFHLARLMKSGRIPTIPVLVDSPMALAALKIYKSAIVRRESGIRDDIAGDSEILDTGTTREIRTSSESIALNRIDEPMIIISASGMATGGRVLHHLLRRLPDKRNTVILAGFQAAGTRGRSLLEGATSVKMLGRYIPVNAEVVSIPAFSVHADQAELINWLRSARKPPQIVYIVHGEPEASEALRTAIVKSLGLNAVVAHHLEQVRVD